MNKKPGRRRPGPSSPPTRAATDQPPAGPILAGVAMRSRSISADRGPDEANILGW